MKIEFHKVPCSMWDVEYHLWGFTSNRNGAYTIEVLALFQTLSMNTMKDHIIEDQRKNQPMYVLVGFPQYCGPSFYENEETDLISNKDTKRI